MSDDAAFLEGVRLMRGYLDSAGGITNRLPAQQPLVDGDAAERALRMIGMRFPEEADAMRSLVAHQSTAECLRMLSEVEVRHREDNEE